MTISYLMFNNLTAIREIDLQLFGIRTSPSLAIIPIANQKLSLRQTQP
ncbi:MAG: hypothetical protein OEV06_00205 [Anaerolineae bacterium]|nr:hypothetical protein [Anaerolineae bacterium]